MSNKLAKTASDVPALAAYSLNQPEELSGLAALLQHHIQDKRLYTDIQGKKHVNVEGWQFAGAMLGIVPIVEKVEDTSTGVEYTFKGYQGKADTIVRHTEFRASVSLLDLRSGNTVGRGIASCSNLESKKRTFDPYAVESMAQTRATGKAFRLLLAWIMQAGGYATTPAEEMPDPDTGAEVVPGKPVAPSPTSTASAEFVASAQAIIKEQVLNSFRTAETLQEVKNLWQNDAKELQQDNDVWVAKEHAKNRLSVPA